MYIVGNKFRFLCSIVLSLYVWESMRLVGTGWLIFHGCLVHLDNRSAKEFFLPAICVTLSCILNMTQINQIFLAHIAKTLSLALPVLSTSTTAMLSEKNVNLPVSPCFGSKFTCNYYIECF